MFKKIILAFCCQFILLNTICQAQQTTYFNNIYDHSGWDDLLADLNSTVLEIPDQGYFVVGDSWDGSADLETRWIMRLDEWGEIIWVKDYGISDTTYRYYYFNGDMLWTEDSNLIVLETTYNKSLADGNNCRLVKLDTSGNVIWEKTIRYGSSETTSRQIIKTKDGGYAFTGTSLSKAILIKLDDSGNKEWEKVYGGSNSDRGFSLIETNDGGYFILGSTESFGAGDVDLYLVKTDSLGNLEWDTTFGDFSTDWGSYIISSFDSSYILVGGKSLNATYESRQAWMIKIDQNANILWEKEYGGAHRDAFKKISQLRDSSFVAIGNTKSYNQDGNYAGWIMKTDRNGDSLWARVYDNTIIDDYFYDFKVTSDKGFIICGSSWIADTSIPNNNAIDAWVIKLDSMGLCDSSYCYPDDTTGIEHSYLQQGTIRIYPNPFSYSTIVSVEPGNNENIGMSLVLYNILGRAVNRTQLLSSETILYRSNLPPGMYFYQITSNDSFVGSGKVVIE